MSRDRSLLIAETIYEQRQTTRQCEEDPWFFISHYCKTLDEHDKKIKPFPDYPYLKELVELFWVEPALFIEKSRKMLVSWLVCAFCLWDVRFNANTLIFFQAQKEIDANTLLERSAFIYEHLPEFLKRPDYTLSYCHLKFPGQYSHIWAIPHGPDILRMHTASRIVEDEWAFQERASETYQALKPTLDGGGQLLAITTAGRKGFAWRKAYDRE